jgi:hypothetical protein
LSEFVLGGERAAYGQQIRCPSKELTAQHRHCLRTAETFPDGEIVYALRRQLSWNYNATSTPAPSYQGRRRKRSRA